MILQYNTRKACKEIFALLLLAIACTLPSNSLQQPVLNRRATQRPQTLQSNAFSTTYTESERPQEFSFDTLRMKEVANVPVAELFGEALGTFGMVGIGSWASMSATFSDTSISLPEIALVWSMAAVASIIITTPLSGAHLNPAMTLALAMFRGFEWNKVLPYSFAQVLGSSAGSAMSYIMNAQAIEDFEVSQDLSRASSIPSARVFGEYYDPSLTGAEAFGVEAFGTAVLAAVVFAVSHPRAANRISVPVPLIIGGTVFSLICFLAPLTQCGMNPARDFGPRLVAYVAGWTDVAFQDCGLYILAPLIGAPTGAALVDSLLYGRKD